MTDSEIRKNSLRRFIVDNPDFRPESNTCTECNTVYTSAAVSIQCARIDIRIAEGK